jgi:hypothetical membrane protein
MAQVTSKISVPAAWLAMGGAVAVTVLTVTLAFLSPEYDPAWRMISEYAAGSYGWVLSLLFASWAISSWALAYALKSKLQTRAGKVGLILLVMAGLGEALSAMFNIFTPVHDPVSMLSILGLPIAAVLISRELARTRDWALVGSKLRRAAWITVASVVLQVATLVLMAVTALSSGFVIPEGVRVLPAGAELPDGAVALVGWANRLLVFAYSGWAFLAAWWALKLRNQNS